MTVEKKLTFFAEQRPAVMVVSHERSGTHFLMNALAACYGYVSLPCIDLDHPSENLLDRSSRDEICDALMALATGPLANIVKSHHSADFFAGTLGRLGERYVIFVMCRNPVPVMLSYWRFLHLFQAWESAGPQVADPLTFAGAAPFGRMMRYQTRPCATVLERWAAHIEGWREAAATWPHVVFVRYEDLDTHYEKTVQSFAQLLGQPPLALTRPARDFNVIPAGPQDPMGTGIPPDIEALGQLCRQTVGDTMASLGY
jgi:hypothetical protein